MKVLLTGGAGYIGSHTAVEVLEAGHEVVVVDNLSNSKAVVIDRVEEITSKSVTFYQEDLSNREALLEICKKEQFDAAIHFAGLKAVGESVARPLYYYDTNLSSTISLLDALLKTSVNSLVFSSSCTVYGEPDEVPVKETARATEGASPYGWTKIVIEQMLRDVSAAHPEFNIAMLRYFNPAGAHPSGRIGEDPRGIPNNLVPFLTQVAIGIRDELVINGEDYETPDGSCIRDYIHVQDLAKGHLAALGRLQSNCGLVTYNLGTGRGYSVKEVVAAFERATNQHLNKKVGPRRPGDVAETWAEPTLARKELNWSAELTIEEICRDAWLWQQQNPNGYD